MDESQITRPKCRAPTYYKDGVERCREVYDECDLTCMKCGKTSMEIMRRDAEMGGWEDLSIWGVKGWFCPICREQICITNTKLHEIVPNLPDILTPLARRHYRFRI